MTIISAIKTFFSKPEALIQAFTPKVDPPLEGPHLEQALKLWHADLMMFGFNHSQYNMTRISPVKCPSPFGGWGFVEGRTKGWRINKRLVVVEADDDMQFTEVCLLLDGVPCLLMENYAGRGVSVRTIAGQDYISEIFNSSDMPLNTVEDLARLPEPVKVLVMDVITANYKLHAEKPDVIEKMLDYSLGDRA